MSSLAVLILAKDEEENIVGAVENAKRVTDEVVVIDAGSTDRTVELAKECGAKVSFRAWTDDFSAQRNFALGETAADWVLYLDADERLNDELVEDVKRVAAAGNPDAQYGMERRVVAFGKSFRHGDLGPDHVVRMFPREKVKWVNQVHEHPECDLPLKNLRGHIEHYTYESWQHWEGKLCRYTTIWAEDAYRRGKRISLPGIFFHSLGGFFKTYVWQAGFLDGWMGLYTCCDHSFYTMLKYLKLYEWQEAEKKSCGSRF